MKDNINKIISSVFEFNDLYHFHGLKSSILSLLNPSKDKIKTTRTLLSQANLS